LKLKSGIPCVIGVDVTPRETHILLADLTGDILKRDSFPTSSDVSYMNEQILSRVERLAADNAEYQLEVGISVPGIADQNTARLYIPYFHWLDWDIGKQISQRTGLSVTVDNDANAVALAELWFGETDVKTARNFILVMIAEGIGTGIIIDGQVYRGENGAAGEFGHMFVADDATVDCSCGRRDCWEAHASEKAILDRYLSQNGSADTTGIDIQHVIRLAQNGEKTAISVLKETATYIGIGISNLIMGFSPQSIIIAGSVVKAWDIIKDEIQQLETRSIRQELSIPPIFPSTLGPYPTNLGAISLVLSRKFAALGSG
jgi:predicted NBD/HSP70 family sugar kinase